MSSSEAKIKLFVSFKGEIAQKLKFKSSELSFSRLQESIKTAFNLQNDDFKLITKDAPHEPEYEMKQEDVEDLSNCQQIFIQTHSTHVNVNPIVSQQQHASSSATTNSVALLQQITDSSIAQKKSSEKRSLGMLSSPSIFDKHTDVKSVMWCCDR